MRLNWAPGAAPPARSELLERLLVGATRRLESDWRAAAFRVLGAGAAMPPVVAARFAASGIREQGYACIASAVHYVAELSHVRLAAQGLLRLAVAEAEALAQDFNRVFFEGDVRMVAAGEFPCLVFRVPLEVRTYDPAAALGRHVDAFLPSGKDAQRLRRLASETEMWLFEHPVNLARAARGEPLISGLWLWGGGMLAADLPALASGAAGEDVFFDAYRAPSLAAAGVVLTESAPGSEAWGRLEQEWLGPVARALRQGRVTRLLVSMRDRIWQVNAGRRWKFWRRSRPWWETFDDAADD